MAERIAAFTLIKGKGECLPIFNDKVNEEVVKMQTRHADEMHEANAELERVRRQRNRMLAEKLTQWDDVMAMREINKGLRERMRERVDVLWAMVYLIGEKIGLWRELK